MHEKLFVSLPRPANEEGTEGHGDIHLEEKLRKILISLHPKKKKKY